MANPSRYGGLETEALARGCTQVVLSTHSFQAPDLYQRLGYRIYGEVDGYPAGHRHIHLVKSLVAPPR